ncbi:5022_t:CDS:2 [Racocetra fulgida]|uniref:5022_t:CDS:1 n=1 Tax=Racocetra fulgida TaxID=60492 RepID=A0A9N9F690_9GLOM|nr:5022_t:CDS:2 [Racocetra fulgida]
MFSKFIILIHRRDLYNKNILQDYLYNAYTTNLGLSREVKEGFDGSQVSDIYRSDYYIKLSMKYIGPLKLELENLGLNR